MDYQEKLEKMVTNGTISPTEAEQFRQSMESLSPALSAIPRKRLPTTAIMAITGAALLAGTGKLLSTPTSSVPATVQKVSETMNQPGATGDIGAGATGLATILLLALVPLGTIFLLLAKTYNTLVSADEEARRASAVIQSCLQRRHDLLPGLQSAVKQALTFEEDVQTSVTGQRGSKLSELESSLQEADSDGASLAPKLAAVMEAYPALRAQENVMDMQRQLEAIERDLMIARNIHAASAAEFNTAARSVLGSIVAKHVNASAATEYFRAEATAQKPLS